MKAAFVFAGQGAQYSGMGKDLYENFEEARKVFEEAGDDIKRLCFEGSDEELRATENTQPCIYAVTMAALRTFEARFAGAPSAGAGFSLGEYAALTAAGHIASVADGIELMKCRGKWMAEAGMSADGAPLGTMAAVIGNPEKVAALVEECRSDGILTAANFNAPMQTVVSGEIAAVERFIKAATDAKLRITPLSVSSAFHSELMAPAAEKMSKLLLEGGYAQAAVENGGFPVYSNYTAQPVSDYRSEKERITKSGANAGLTNGANAGLTEEAFAELMGLQLMSSVQWVNTIRNIIDTGVDTFIEFGPGRTLSGLIKKIDKSVRTLRVENCETLEETLKEIGDR